MRFPIGSRSGSRADSMHSHVIWARDLGAEHNKLLLDLLHDRTAWLLDADDRDPQLLPYAEAINKVPPSRPRGSPGTVPDQEE